MSGVPCGATMSGASVSFEGRRPRFWEMFCDRKASVQNFRWEEQRRWAKKALST